MTVTIFRNSDTVHLECKGVNSGCLFEFGKDKSFVLQNNTTKCVEVEDRYVSFHSVMMHVIF